MNNICPRCEKNPLDNNDVMNSHSHTGTHDGVPICNDCATEESLLLQGMEETLTNVSEALLRQVKWENKKW